MLSSSSSSLSLSLSDDDDDDDDEFYDAEEGKDDVNLSYPTAAATATAAAAVASVSVTTLITTPVDPVALSSSMSKVVPITDMLETIGIRDMNVSSTALTSSISPEHDMTSDMSKTLPDHCMGSNSNSSSSSCSNSDFKGSEHMKRKDGSTSSGESLYALGKEELQDDVSQMPTFRDSQTSALSSRASLASDASIASSSSALNADRSSDSNSEKTNWHRKRESFRDTRHKRGALSSVFRRSGGDKESLFLGTGQVGPQRVRVTCTGKPALELKELHQVQLLRCEETGMVWTAKFSSCGKLLATAGQDAVVRVWVVCGARPRFEAMRQSFSRRQRTDSFGDSNIQSPLSKTATLTFESNHSRNGGGTNNDSGDDSGNASPIFNNGAYSSVFEPEPFVSFRGHHSDVMALSFSKSNFLLSSSTDKTVRLWHVSQSDCLCCFGHSDFVSSVAFHPQDDRYFLSGSLDAHIRLWSIPDKHVEIWNKVDGPGVNMITAANFCLNGKMVACGTFDGRVMFFSTDRMKYHTQITIKSSKHKKSKICGIEPMPGEDKILITSNDSRVRLYDMKDLSLTVKYRGHVNTSSQIGAYFSQNGKYIVCGSDNGQAFLWNTYFFDTSRSVADKIKGRLRRDRNIYHERFTMGNGPVTVAVFAPYSTLGIKDAGSMTAEGELLIATDDSGNVKVFVNWKDGRFAIDSAVNHNNNNSE